MSIIGTCSKCGGPVGIPDHWDGLLPAVPTCQYCGAIKANQFGPVIEMTGGSAPNTTNQQAEFKNRSILAKGQGES